METLFNTDLLSNIQENDFNKMIYAISLGNLQVEAIEKLGRKLTDDEIEIAKDGLSWGIGTGLDIIYNTIFTEMIEKK